MSDPFTAWIATDASWHFHKSDKLNLYRGVLRYIFCAAWLGIFATVAIAFTVLSKAQQRRGPIFKIQCIAFAMGVLYNILDIAIEIRRFRDIFSFAGNKLHNELLIDMQVALTAFRHIIPLIADLALVPKILSFYPRLLYPSWMRLLRIAPLFALLIPRVGLTAAAIYKTWRWEHKMSPQLGLTLQATKAHAESDLPNYLHEAEEYTLQAIYCGYSAIFLLQKSFRFASNSTQLNRSGHNRTVRFLIEALLMSFIPPFLLSIASVVILSGNFGLFSFFDIIAGMLVNTSVLFGLLASQWSTIRSLHDQKTNVRVKNGASQQRQAYKEIQDMVLSGTLLSSVCLENADGIHTDGVEVYDSESEFSEYLLTRDLGDAHEAWTSMLQSPLVLARKQSSSLPLQR